MARKIPPAPTTRNAAPAPPYTTGEVSDPVRGSSVGTAGGVAGADGTGVGSAGTDGVALGVALGGATGAGAFVASEGDALGTGDITVGGGVCGGFAGGTDGLGIGVGVVACAAPAPTVRTAQADSRTAAEAARTRPRRS